MALTFTFVGYTPNRAVYKITSVSGGSATLPNNGGTTPDLSTDVPATTPIGAYLRTAVASDTAAQNLLNNNTAFKVVVRCTSANLAPAYFATEGLKDSTSGLAKVLVNSAAVAAGDCSGVLELELYHTIAK